MDPGYHPSHYHGRIKKRNLVIKIYFIQFTDFCYVQCLTLTLLTDVATILMNFIKSCDNFFQNKSPVFFWQHQSIFIMKTEHRIHQLFGYFERNYLYDVLSR